MTKPVTTFLTAALLALALIAATPTPAKAQVDARLLQQPDVSETHIAFVYGGDIWVVEKTGGTARRLTSPRGQEDFPRFSPDGSRIAFSGNYDGNTDVYVVPSMGGDTRRVTHHPGNDRLVDWTPDGARLVLASNRASGLPSFRKLFTVSPEGGLPEALPMAYGEFGSFSPDGERIAYTPDDRSFRNWKRYRGGAAPEIWVMELESLEAENISDSDANDQFPMWHGQTIYFLSDRGPNLRHNIWAYDVASGEMRQLTEFTDFDITWPAIGPSDLVFQAGGTLYRMDVATEEIQPVSVNVVTDLASTKPRTESVGNRIQWAGISPTGKRAVFQARGEVVTVPAEHGAVRNLTRASGSAERYPAWSPDGRWVAYWSDASGEYELVLEAADGAGDTRTLTDLGPGYRYRPFWAPDSDRLAFIDHTQTIRILDVESGDLTEVGRTTSNLHGGLQGFEMSWSSDGRWLAYSRVVPEAANSAVFLYDSENRELHQATSAYYNDSDPVFDPDGEYLYFKTDRNLSPVYTDFGGGDWVYPNATELVAVPLRRDVPSPLEPRNDAEPVEESSSEEEDQETDEAEDQALEIHLEGFESRAVVLPPDAGQYGSIRAVSGKLVYHRFPRAGSGGDESPLVYWDLEAREEQTLIEDVSGWDLSADGKKVLVTNSGQWAIIDLAPDQSMQDPLAINQMAMILDPPAEWRQVFTEVWRTYRDYFYDAEIHGLDWDGLRAHYGNLVDDAVTRWDVNFVIGELIAEINASHTYVGGGDTESEPSMGVGLLGVDWALDDGAYRIQRIVRGAPWDVENMSPLDRPGVEVSEGDYVLAVNGTPLRTDEDPYAAFQGLAGETVVLTVNDEPSIEGSREVLVETLTNEYRLRSLEWIEGNRQTVLEASNGQIGYMYVPNTGVQGQSEVVRQFKYQHSLDGLIIDERWNGGGQLPDRFIELMNRETVGHIYFRHGATVHHPMTHHGHKAMLINGQAGSGGDAFPWFFREMDAGVLVGERTWGGLIGPASGHQTIDGGFYTAPPGRLYRNDGEWFAEGHGVEPDIPVTDDQEQLAQGVDPQLQAAIEELMRRIRENPPTHPATPERENRVVTGGG